MATKADVGISRHHNPNVAGREAAEQALEKAGVDRPDFVFVFGSLGYDQPGYGDEHRLSHHAVITFEQLVREAGIPLDPRCSEQALE